MTQFFNELHGIGANKPGRPLNRHEPRRHVAQRYRTGLEEKNSTLENQPRQFRRSLRSSLAPVSNSILYRKAMAAEVCAPPLKQMSCFRLLRGVNQSVVVRRCSGHRCLSLGLWEFDTKSQQHSQRDRGRQDHDPPSASATYHGDVSQRLHASICSATLAAASSERGGKLAAARWVQSVGRPISA